MPQSSPDPSQFVEALDWLTCSGSIADGRSSSYLSDPAGVELSWRDAVVSVSRQHGKVPDLLWAEVKSFFDPDLMGTLPDVWVGDASVDDWQAVFDLVEARDWRSEYSEGDLVMPLLRAEQVLSRPVDAECPRLRVWPAPDVLAIFWFLSKNGVDPVWWTPDFWGTLVPGRRS